MSALLKKDLPWLLFCLVGGLVGLTIALVQDGPLQVFVLGASRLQGGFHVSWIAGLLLGGIAGCFDELLGTREFLQQRPIAAGRLALSRLLGCGLVLLTWTLFAPVLAWSWAQLFDDRVPLGEFGGWPQWLATNSVAWSACGIGLCAASLPLRGPLRLLAAFVLFYSGFLIVHLFRQWSMQQQLLLHVPPRAVSAEWAYGLGHALLASLTGGVAWVAQQARRDVDLPWNPKSRVLVTSLLVAAAVVLANCCIIEWQSLAVSRLQQQYPQPKQVGREVVLVRDPYWAKQVVGADHQPTDRLLGAAADIADGHDLRWVTRNNEFEEPGWATPQGVRGKQGWVWHAADGRLWWMQDGKRAKRLVRKGADAAPVLGGVLREVGPSSASTLVFLEPGAAGLWRFVPDRAEFVGVPTPDGGRLSEFAYALRDQLNGVALPEGLQIDPAREPALTFLRGERANYALVDGTLRLLPDTIARNARGPGQGRTESRQDPVEYTITLPATADRDAFTHTFAPRTSHERYYATQALGWSLLRPPVAQVGGHVLASTPWPGWLLDALVIDGRRTWLVLANAALWLFAAFQAARRLRRLGAPRRVVRGWALATALLGPVALLASVVLERPRAFADRRAITPPAPPRIASLPTTATAS